MPPTPPTGPMGPTHPVIEINPAANEQTNTLFIIPFLCLLLCSLPAIHVTPENRAKVKQYFWLSNDPAPGRSAMINQGGRRSARHRGGRARAWSATSCREP